MKKIVILLGAPGSGKGTQAKIIASKYDYTHISTGDLLRGLEQDSDVDPQDKAMLENMKTGKLVPDDLVYKLAFEKIRAGLTSGRGVVLDGAIRNVTQAEKYQEFFEQLGYADEVSVLEIRISDQTSFNRLAKRKVCERCGYIMPYSPETENLKNCPHCTGRLKSRQDDKPEIIKKRIREQGNQALAPLVKFYRDKGLLRVIDGERSISQVEKEVEKKLENV